MKLKPILKLLAILVSLASFTMVLVSKKTQKITCQTPQCTEKETQKPSPAEADQLLYGGFNRLIVSTSH